jgi:class 3 adenylate cyclase/tetratricopeptide (TPR) repeat protein
MFADLVGSTAFGEVVDAETARREMGAYHELSRDVVEEHGGAIIKFIGDGVMAGFGVTDMREDDADRAVRAGLELQRRFVETADGIQDRHRVEVGLRVGINTGEVVIATDDADMVGDPINTAARIEAQCTPGRVLVGEQTWRLTRSTVDYEVLGEVEVKGKAAPIATFQVLAAVEDEEIATPFVGREAELQALAAALENTIADAAPQLVTVIGSPGVGKTRLAAELVRRASEVTSFDLRVDRAGAATFEPVADLLRMVSNLPAGLDDAATVDHLSGFVGDVDDQERLVPLLAGFVGAAPMRSTEESLWAARRLVEFVVSDRPAVIVVDDIQWAEPLFLDLLEHLVEWTEGAAFLVALARPEIREIRPAFAEVGRRVSEVIALEGLDSETMAELAAHILGGRTLPQELVDRLPESTEGNPLFVRELVRMLVDDGVITETSDGWTLAIAAEAVEVPPTIISLLASRVERMDDDERRVVEAAAVVGSEFARGAVGTLLPRLGAAQLDRILERLRRQEIFDATGTYWGDEPVWRFHHVLIRDAAYRRLLKERRADMHRRVGQWTENSARALSGEHEISIAFHFEQAHGYRRELGPLDDEAIALGGKAADLLAVAAERAVARDDLAAAGSLSSRALAILDDGDPRRPELLLAACEAWFSAGRVHDGVAHLEELRTYSGDERTGAWTTAFEGQYAVLTEPERLAEVEPTVAAAASRLAELGDDAGVAKARLVRALIFARTGRVGDCEEELDAALAAARSAGDRRRISSVLAAAPVAALWGPSPVARAGGRCLDIIRLLRITSASPMVEAVSIRCQAVLEAMRGRFDEARTLLACSQEIVEELGLGHGILECRLFAGYIELLAGDPAAAVPHLRVAHAGLGTLGVGADAGQAAALLSQALLEQGDVGDAALLADESARLAGQNLQTAIMSAVARARVAATQGRHEDATRLAAEAVSLAADTDLTMNHADALAGLALVYAAAGDEARADQAAGQARELFDAKGAAAGEVRAASAAAQSVKTRAEAGDADAAVARSAVLTVEPAPDELVPLSNLATRQFIRFGEAIYQRGDLDAALALASADFRGEDRRAVIGMVVHGESAAANYKEFVDNPGAAEWHCRILAIAGDRLAFARQEVIRAGTDFSSPYLAVFEVDSEGAGQIMIVFDENDFASACDEIHQRYAAGEGAPYAATLDIGHTFLQLLDDPDAFARILADDFLFVDHTPLGFGQLTGLEYAEIASVQDVSESRYPFTRRYLDLAHGVVLVELVLFNADALWNFLQLSVIADGRLSRSEAFAVEDEAAARRRFAELTAATGPGELAPLANLATRQLERFGQAIYERGDLDTALAVVSPEFRAKDHRRGVGMEIDRDGVAANWQEFLDNAGAIEWRRDVLAIAGDRLLAARQEAVRPDSGFISPFLSVVEVDGDGLIVAFLGFEENDLRGVGEEMSRRYALGEGAPFASTLDRMIELSSLINDRDAFAACCSDDCLFTDHRSLGFGTLTGARYADRLATANNVSDQREHLIRRFVSVADGATLVDVVLFNNDAEWSVLILSVLRDDLLWRQELFAIEDEAEARARFAELTAQR